MPEKMELYSKMMAAEDEPNLTALFYDAEYTEGCSPTITLLFSV